MASARVGANTSAAVTSQPLVYSFGNRLHIRFADRAQAAATVSIYDLSGQMVRTIDNRSARSSTLEVSLPTNGGATLYLVQIQSQQGSIVGKVLIK